MATKIVQTSPSSYPSSNDDDSTWKDINVQSEISTVRCPPGTIPIWKNNKKVAPLSWIELLTYQQIGSKPSKKHNFEGVHVASIVRDSKLFGTRASTSVYELDIMAGKTGRHSGAYASLSNGTSVDDLDFITAGWFVWPQYSGDNHVRFFTYWDPKTGNWWLTFGKENKPVGYWVNSIFNHMDNGAYKVHWGGGAEADPDEPSPPMGSGHFPSEGFGKAAFYRDIMILNDRHEWIVPNVRDCYAMVTRTECYKVSRPWIANDGIGIFFGGPGGCKH
ncbi:hypothetical protein LUZ60_009551 [Juncus effusus]|nr:hypothetical protein LUZ60_009551 [Juncus effusus]